jgi:hypothetical protein
MELAFPFNGEVFSFGKISHPHSRVLGSFWEIFAWSITTKRIRSMRANSIQSIQLKQVGSVHMMIRTFRLTNEPGGLGLSCSPAGLALAGVPLLAKTAAGFEPRPASEIAILIKAAYGANNGPIQFQSRLEAIAEALNNRDFGLAAIAAVQMRIPELSSESAARVARAEEKLSKYNYNPNEPRDWHGRWTSDGSASPVNITALGIERDQGGDPHVFDRPQRVADNASSDAKAPSNDSEGEGVRGPSSLEETFERKYDDLGPVDFAKEVIRFGDWLGREGKNLSPPGMAHALAEYSFLQDRLSFWLNYDYKPATAQGNLLSAALTLYQGAVVGGFVRPGRLPESMLVVAGMASLFSGSSPRPPYKKPTAEEAPGATLQAPEEVERFGPIVDNSEVKIVWGKGINEQGVPAEAYIEREYPDLVRLEPGATTFDHSNPISGQAISTKTLNTLSMGKIKNPDKIYEEIKGYVNEVLDYEPHKVSDLDPAMIETKSIYLFVPEWTSPIQWRHLLRAIIYGKDNGVSIVIIRVRE